MLATALLALVASGCRGPRHEAGTAWHAPELAARLAATFTAPSPSGYRALHRAILTVAGRRVVLDGYLLVRHPGDVRLVASGDMGGTLFDVARLNGRDRVLANAIDLRPAWLLAGPLKDARSLATRKPSPLAALERLPGDKMALVDTYGDGRREVYVFDATGERLRRYVEARDGHETYRIDFTDYQAFPGWPRPLASRIEIAHYAMHYTVSITVRGIRALPLEDRHFREVREP